MPELIVNLAESRGQRYLKVRLAVHYRSNKLEETKERMIAALPLGRMPDAGEIAAHCLWLLSPAADYANGECYVVDGGLSLGRSLWE